MSKKRRNPVAHAPILRKGGVHQKSRSAERQIEKRKLRKSISAYTATLCGRDGLTQHILRGNSRWSMILKKLQIYLDNISIDVADILRIRGHGDWQ